MTQHCDFQPKEQLLVCSNCNKTVNPTIFDVSEPQPCRAWHNVQTTNNNIKPSPTEPTIPTKPPTKLAVISCLFNFGNYQNIVDNYLRFKHEMRWWGVPFYDIVAITDQQYKQISHSNPYLTVRVDPTNNPKTVLWQKEHLLNLVERALPKRYDAIAWVDADILFLNRNWYRNTLDALQTKPVVQMWRQWHFVGGAGELTLTGQSVGEDGSNYLKKKGHPGGAWAARREIFPLYPYHVVGGGDTLAVDAWLGLRNTFAQNQMSIDWLTDYTDWADNQFAMVGGNIGTLQSDCMHLYHGDRKNRLYSERSMWLKKNGFDPNKHLTTDESSLLRWSNQAPPNLVSLIYGYLNGDRQEDDNLDGK